MSIGLQPLIPFTGLRGGPCVYYDSLGNEPQMVRIDYVEGEAYATFLDAETEDGEVTLLARDMAGEFRQV